MSRRPQSPPAASTGPRKDQADLLRDIERARADLAASWLALRQRGSPGRAMRDSLSNHLPLWIAAAAATGVAVALLARSHRPRRTARNNAPAAAGMPAHYQFALGALKILAGLAKPVVTALVTEHLAGAAARNLGDFPPARWWRKRKTAP